MSKNRVMAAKNAKARKMLIQERKLRRDIHIITDTLLGNPTPAPEPVGVSMYKNYARSKNDRKQSAYNKMLATNKITIKVVKA